MKNIKTRIKKIVAEIDKHLPRAVFHPFAMSSKEKKLFNFLVKNSKGYLEFGTGGSTFRVLQKSKTKIYSIDSSKDWLSLMKEYKQIRQAENKGRLKLFHVDIGPTGEWGKPLDNTHREKFPAYSSHVFNLIDKNDVDTVLIDGRFRVACALKTILECHNNNIKILIHDFSMREQYHVVLKYFDIIDQVESLIALKIKPDINLDAVSKDYELYKYNVD